MDKNKEMKEEEEESDDDIDFPLLFSRIENMQPPFELEKKSNKITSKGRSVFPIVLYQLLEKSEEEDFTSIISWLSDRRSFKVHKRDDFVSSVLPKYFKQTKIKSFHRQLNIYGFIRINQGQDAGAYRHDFFIRGQPQLLNQIKRFPVKKDIE